jgi:hypothetical protein
LRRALTRVEQKVELRDFAIVVVGASYGGVEAMQKLFAPLPSTIPAAIFTVLHIGPHPSQFPDLLNGSSALPAHHARHGEPIRAGNIYVAPPDHHLLVHRGHVALSRGPRVNWARPAVDPLFRSAAKAYGSGVIGVILTGRLNDGTRRALRSQTPRRYNDRPGSERRALSRHARERAQARWGRPSCPNGGHAAHPVSGLQGHRLALEGVVARGSNWRAIPWLTVMFSTNRCR